MKLNADGRRRLEAMKKALAAGMPLAGLLAFAAGCGKGAGEGKTSHWQGEIIIGNAPKLELDSPCEEDSVPMGEIIEDNPIAMDALSELGKMEDIGPLDIDFSSEPVQPPVPLREVWPGTPPIIMQGMSIAPGAQGEEEKDAMARMKDAEEGKE